MTNGDHAQQREERSRELARSPQRTRKMRAPLRAVTNRELVDNRLVETLECGHIQEPRAVPFGSTPLPDRRRCVACLEALEASVENGES
jgi:hypothetical protein